MPCKNLEVDHTNYLNLLRKIRAIKGVKKVFIRSGIRYDYMLEDKNTEFMNELIEHHISGQLKVAPEHCSAVVLDKMGKPHIEAYKKFQEKFYQTTKRIGKEQYLVPYLMSSHRVALLMKLLSLQCSLKKIIFVQSRFKIFIQHRGRFQLVCFTQVLDPYTMQTVYVPKTAEDKAMQRALLQYFKPQNQSMVIKALKKARRTDLIGMGKSCLVAPDKDYLKEKKTAQNQKGKNSWQKGKSKNK